jgi:hypothetical protein
MRTQLEQMQRTLASRMGELEARLDTRFERLGTGAARPVPAVNPVPAQVETLHDEVQRDHALARDHEARHAQVREEERLREQRVRDERPRAEDRPADSGWRRWF